MIGGLCLAKIQTRSLYIPGKQVNSFSEISNVNQVNIVIWVFGLCFVSDQDDGLQELYCMFPFVIQ